MTDAIQTTPEAVEKEASLMGWSPKEQFRGPPEEWIDAQAFVEKGRQIAPIMRKNNERLLAEVGGLRDQLKLVQGDLASTKQSMEDLKAFHDESTKAQVAKARMEILRDLKQAKEEGNVDDEVEAHSRLSQFDAAGKASATAPVNTANPTPRQQAAAVSTELTPEFKAWQAENTWFGTDPVKSGLAQGVAQKLRNEGNTLTGRAFLEIVAAEVDKHFGSAPSRVNRVEGGGGQSSSGSSGDSYGDLPAEAKATCDKLAERFVGDTKAYKTKKDWQTFYAKEYFKGN